MGGLGPRWARPGADTSLPHPPLLRTCRDQSICLHCFIPQVLTSVRPELLVLQGLAHDSTSVDPGGMSSWERWWSLQNSLLSSWQ